MKNDGFPTGLTGAVFIYRMGWYLTYQTNFIGRNLLVLRLARTGRRNQPKYRLVIAEHSKPLDGKVVEVVGHYNPADPSKTFVINKEAILRWLDKGVRPSNTVARLLNVKEGFDLPVHQRPAREPKTKAQEEKPAADSSDSQAGKKPEATPAGEQASEKKLEEESKQEEKPVDKPQVQEERKQESESADDGTPQDATEAKKEESTQEKSDQ